MDYTLENDAYLSSVFNKLDIFAKNRNLVAINEAQYRRYNRDIALNKNETKSIRNLYEGLELQYASNSLKQFGFTERDTQDLIDSNYDYRLFEESFIKRVKNFGRATKEKAIDLFEELKNLHRFFMHILKNAATTVSNLIKQFLQLLSKVGDTISESVKKILGEKGMRSFNDVGLTLPDNEATSGFDESDKGFLSLVYDYLKARVKTPEAKRLFSDFGESNGTLNESTRVVVPRKDYLNEGLKDSFDKFVHTNKAFQWLIGYRPGNQKIIWWKSILVSIVASIIITLVIPAILTVCFGSGPIVVGICFAIKIIWSCKGVARVLLARYTSKAKDEKFWNKPTAIAFIIAVAFMIIPHIPAVREWMADSIKSFFEATGLSKFIDKAEDFFRDLLDQKDNVSVVTRYENVRVKMEKFIPRDGQSGAFDNSPRHSLSPGSKSIDAINAIKGSNTLSPDMKNGLIGLQKLVNDQTFKSSHAMDEFIVGKLKGAKNAAYVFDMSRAIGKGGKFEGKSVAWVTKWLTKRLEEKGINGTTLNLLNDQMREHTHSLAGANVVVATDIPVSQGLDFEGIFQDIGKEAGLAGDATGTFGALLNDLNVTNTVTDIITTHTWVDFIAQNFTPMFFPILGPSLKSEGWELLFSDLPEGSATRYPIVDIQIMGYDELNSIESQYFISPIKARELAKKQREGSKDALINRLKEFKEINKGLSKSERQKGLEELRNEVNVYKQTPVSKQKFIVFFTTGKFYFETQRVDDEGKKIYKEIELKHEPIIAYNPNTLYEHDLCSVIYTNATSMPLTTHLMRGLFKNHVAIVPSNTGDNTKKDWEAIKKYMNPTFDSMIKNAANIYGVYNIAKYNESSKTWTPTGGDPNKNMLYMGMFKRNEICEIWNEEDEAWSYLWIDDISEEDNPSLRKLGEKVPVVKDTEFIMTVTPHSIDPREEQQSSRDAESQEVKAKKNSKQLLLPTKASQQKEYPVETSIVIPDKQEQAKEKAIRFNFPAKEDRKHFYNDLKANGQLSKEDYEAFQNKFIDGTYYIKSSDGSKKLSDGLQDRIVDYAINVCKKYAPDGIMTADNFRKARKSIIDKLYKNNIILESFRY